MNPAHLPKPDVSGGCAQLAEISLPVRAGSEFMQGRLLRAVAVASPQAAIWAIGRIVLVAAVIGTCGGPWHGPPCSMREPRAGASPAAYCHGMPDGQQRNNARVFISYARETAEVAEEIARALDGCGMEVRVDQLQMPPGEPWLRHLDHAIGRAQVFVAVLPGDAQGGHLAQWADAARAIQRRGTDVVPVVLPPAGIRDLAGWPAIEYAGPDADTRLADRIRLCARIDLADFAGPRLEALVSDLLQRQGWIIASRARLPDAGYDIRAVRSTRPDHGWPAESLIEIKAYRHGRVSVREIHRLAAVVREYEGTAGLLDRPEFLGGCDLWEGWDSCITETAPR